VSVAGERVSLAKRRITHWDQVSRLRALSDIESRELERAMKQVRHDEQRRAAGRRPKNGGTK
jgi:hypothetical protein